MGRFCVSALLICSCFLASISADRAAWHTLYDVTILDAPWAVPHDGYTRVMDINKRGQILGVGHADHPGYTDSFLYDDGTFIPLNRPGLFFTAMNGRGQLVGYGGFEPDYVRPRPFLYEDGIVSPLLPSGAFQAFAYDINNRGAIVGAYENIPYRGSHGFLYKDGVFTILDVPNAYGTQLVAINDHGVALGRYENNDHIGVHGFVYVANHFEYFDVPGARSTDPAGLNDRGEIVGTYLDEGGAHGFTLDRRGFTTLDVPDADETRLGAINNRGQIVGSYLVKGGNPTRILDTAGFVYDSGVFVLTDPQLLVPQRINDKGEITGGYLDSLGTHAFVARPKIETIRSLSLWASPSHIPAGGRLTAAWTGIVSPSSTDWIGLYEPGAAAAAYIDWIYVSCSKTPGSATAAGSCPFVLPANLAPGTYQLRLLANDGFTVLTTSNNATVTSGDGGPTLSANPASVGIGGTLTAAWTTGTASPSATDWIGLYPIGASNTAYADWMYVSCTKTPESARAGGSCSFVVPGNVAPGTYQLRLLGNDTFIVRAISNTFTVSP